MTIRRFLGQHQEWVLAIIGIAIFGGVVASAVWTVENVSEYVGSALSADSAQAQKIEFRLDQFKGLDLRGLSQLSK